MSQNAKLELAKWFTIVSLLSVVMGHMFYSAWSSGAWEVLHAALGTLGVDPVAGTQFVLTMAFGGFTTLLVLMYNDYRKQYQAILLGVGQLIVIGVIYVFGFGGFLFEPSVMNLLAFVLGIAVVVTVVVKLGDLSGVDIEQSEFGHAIDRNGTDLKFKNTTKLVKYTILSVVMLGLFFNFYLVTGASIVQPGVYLVFTIAFYVAMERFISIDIEEEQGVENSFELIGPKQSGKTFSTLGLYFAAAEDEKYDFVDDKMDDLIGGYGKFSQINSGSLDTEVGFDLIDGTGLDENDEYWFEVTVNEGLTKKAKIRTMDYQGELLPDIASAVEAIETDGGVDEPEDEETKDEETKDETQERDISEQQESDGSQEAITINTDGDSESDSSETRESADQTPIDHDIDRIKSPEDNPSSGDVESENSTEFADVEEAEYDVLQREVDKLKDDISDPIDKSTESAGTEQGERDDITDEESGFDKKETATESEDRSPSSGQLSGFESKATTVEENGSSPDFREQVINEVSDNITHSDKLVMLLDVERFVGEYSDDAEISMGIQSMKKIARGTDPDEVILVATKSDYLIDRWQDENDSEYGPAKNETKWNEFREFVSDEFYSNIAIKGFMQIVNTRRVYPVYFHTDENYNLTTDEDGEIQTEGYDDLLDALVE